MSLSEGVQLTYNLLMERDVRCPRHNNFFIQLPGERTERWAELQTVDLTCSLQGQGFGLLIRF